MKWHFKVENNDGIWLKLSPESKKHTYPDSKDGLLKFISVVIFSCYSLFWVIEKKADPLTPEKKDENDKEE